MIKQFFILIICCIAISRSAQAEIPSFQAVRDAYQKSDAILLDRHHEVIHELRIDKHGRRLGWVSLKEISPAVLSAIIYAEDKRFYKHSGVDLRAMGSAFASIIVSGGPRGASTITMQVASILNKELHAKQNRRSVWQKWRQIQEARDLEKKWSKPEILEAYLNLIIFRGELQGINAASRGLFGKDPHGLDNLESLILAVLIRAPNAPLDEVTSRGFLLGSAMKLQIDCKDITSKVKEVLAGPPFLKPDVALAPHVAFQLLKPYKEKAGGTASVISTLDGRLQHFATEVSRRHLLSIRSQNVQDAALLVVENKTGDVLAYIGNTGDLASARYVDGVHAKRQAGSTLKPFLYGLAFEKRILTAASIIDDSPLDISVPGGIYRPGNYDNHFQGPVTARTALASSLNVPAVKALNLVGTGAFVRRLRDLGFEGLIDSGDFYGPSLALGSADVSLWEMVNAYRTLANEGLWSELNLMPSKDTKVTGKRLFSREASFIISDILSDRESRSNTFGLENPLSTRFWSAVKTGTSKDMRDNWCIGYSSEYTVGVWVGNFSGEPMWNVTGITGAAPIWTEIMDWLQRNQINHPIKPPSGLIAKQIEFPQLGLSRKEWFIKGTEPLRIKQGISHTNYKIVYPADNTIIALDPDIPGGQQMLFFESEPRDNHLQWMLNKKGVGAAGSILTWRPTPGKYILDLVDQEDHTLDSVSFEVRGLSIVLDSSQRYQTSFLAKIGILKETVTVSSRDSYFVKD